MALKVAARAKIEAKKYDFRVSKWLDSYSWQGIKNVKYYEIAPDIQVYYAKKNFGKFS